jgi:hypothetical protein
MAARSCENKDCPLNCSQFLRPTSETEKPQNPYCLVSFNEPQNGHLAGFCVKDSGIEVSFLRELCAHHRRDFDYPEGRCGLYALQKWTPLCSVLCLEDVKRKCPYLLLKTCPGLSKASEIVGSQPISS